MSPVVVPAEPLRDFANDVLLALGAPADVAAEVATHLVRANLSGHDVHGVGQLRLAAARVESGELVPGARPAVVRETPAAALLDGGRGFGQHSTAVALDWCVEHARTCGVAAAAVRHSCDVGRIAEYAERAAEAGLLAIVTVGAAGQGAGETMLHGGRARFFGPNPWAFAAPGQRRSFAFDASATTVGEAQVRLARARREPLPPDCILDPFGRPSTDPDDFYAGGGLAALGGAVAGMKGLGLALASALFSGLAADDGPAGVFVEAIDPAAFGDPAAYRERVDGVLAAAKSARPGAGRSEVVLPGELEARLRRERAGGGIRLPETTWTDLAALSERFGVQLPEL
jgi:uncharacterized oxidoreductase